MAARDTYRLMGRTEAEWVKREERNPRQKKQTTL
jgi:hypothetical protein